MNGADKAHKQNDLQNAVADGADWRALVFPCAALAVAMISGGAWWLLHFHAIDSARIPLLIGASLASLLIALCATAGLRQTHRNQSAQSNFVSRHELLQRQCADLEKTNVELGNEVQKNREKERNVLLAIEMELTRIGLELHDELGQNLTGVALLAKTLGDRITEKGLPESGDAWRVLGLINDTIRQVRVISHGLSPHIIGTDGLIDALRQLACDINSLGVVTCQFTHDPDIHIEDELAARGLYRIAQEAVNNALKHSKAKSIAIELRDLNDTIHLDITDDGIGISETDRDIFGNSILHSIKYRAGAINADLQVSGLQPNGTGIAITLSGVRQRRPLEDRAGTTGINPWDY